MPDDQPASRPRARRPRRFVVRDGDDHRATEKIEQFLSGPRARSRSRAKPADPATAETTLDTRTDFAAAIDREAARTERYGRPATVIAVEFAVDDRAAVAQRSWPAVGAQDRQIDRLAGPIGFTLRREARDVDRIARVAPNRFHVLLPETTAADAARYVDRARRACEVWFAGASLPVELRIQTASSGAGRTLRDALADLDVRRSA
jgi:GGDEF domain-containing protein